MAQGQPTGMVVSAGRFELNIGPLKDMAFSELQGINSKVTPQEYIYSDNGGNIVHTKQFGKTEPPTVTLKRGLDKTGNDEILKWHMMARIGDDNARQDGTLKVLDAGGNVAILYIIEDGWCQELTISGIKAGDSAVATIEMKITCANIQSPL